MRRLITGALLEPRLAGPAAVWVERSGSAVVPQPHPERANASLQQNTLLRLWGRGGGREVAR